MNSRDMELAIQVANHKDRLIDELRTEVKLLREVLEYVVPTLTGAQRLKAYNALKGNKK